MKFDEAKKISEIIRQYEAVDKKIKRMSCGFDDEWVLKNTHNGTTIELTPNEHAAFKEILIGYATELEKTLRSLGIEA